MKSIWIISVRPNHVCNILNGLKTQELRTRIGNIKEGDEMHLYCTKAKPWLQFNAYENQWELTKHNDKKVINPNITQVNGKVVAKFIVGKVEVIYRSIDSDNLITDTMSNSQLLKLSCLTNGQLESYCDYDNPPRYVYQDKSAYSLSITQLEIFDKPRELGEYFKQDISEAMTHWEYERANGCQAPCPADVYRITRAPQSYCHAWVEE